MTKQLILIAFLFVGCENNDDVKMYSIPQVGANWALTDVIVYKHQIRLWYKKTDSWILKDTTFILKPDQQ